ncbi:hypothetical protein AOP6_1081 [Desulfuromonas sp. AOP6]|nr:hypothetical protein AOP6_1081 [Desulfuromonas sp. AOP6]
MATDWKVIYTTNAIESINMSLRKVTRPPDFIFCLILCGVAPSSKANKPICQA